MAKRKKPSPEMIKDLSRVFEKQALRKNL